MVKKIGVYHIDKDVPIPSERTGTVPVISLEVGESIVFPIEERDNVQARASQIKAASNKEFTIRKISDTECRVWRTK